MESNKPTAEQMEALRTFAAANGRTWKSKLNDAWMSGRYDNYPATDRCDLLQQVRNDFGPSWLVRLSFSTAPITAPPLAQAPGAASLPAGPGTPVGNPATDGRQPQSAARLLGDGGAR